MALSYIEASGATVYRDGSVVVKDVSFELEGGECLGIVGDNGSGKTSVLLALAGLAKHRGEIKILGRRLGEYRRIELAGILSMLFDDPDLQFVLNRVGDEVAFTLENLGYPRERIVERVLKWLEIMGLRGFEDREIRLLSGGQRQRVVLASIFALEEARILLLDNPWANLDPVISKILTQLIIEAKNGGKGVVVTAVSEDEVWFADKVVRLPGRQRRVDLGRLNLDLGPEREITLEVDGVVKTYPGFRLKVSFTHSSSDGPLCILGRNGAGKSTLGKIVTGLLKPTEGRIRVDGMRPGRGVSSYVFQEPEKQFVGLTPLEDVARSYMALGSPRGKAVRRARKLLENLGLGGVAETGVFKLSRGVKRLISILSAAVLGPRLLFLDEPTLSLDRWGTRLMARVVEAMSRGALTLIATHDIDFACRVCGRAIVLKEGAVSYDGDPCGLREELL